MHTVLAVHTCTTRVGLDPLPVEVRFKAVTLSLSYVHAGKLKVGGQLVHRIKQNPEFAGVREMCEGVGNVYAEAQKHTVVSAAYMTPMHILTVSAATRTCK